MYRLTAFLFLFLTSTLGFSQISSKASLSAVFKVDSSNYADVTKRFLSKQDYSSLWARNTQAIGFIGNDYERLSMIILTSAQTDNKNVYTVSGKSRVKSNVCSFTGTLTITRIYKNNNQDNGIIVGTYHFKEDSTQSHPGLFTGTFATRFTFNNTGVAYFENTNTEEYFINNAFVGEWNAYKGKMKMKANWGDKRIPESGTLDVGKSEFSVNPKFVNAGWKNYVKAYGSKDPEAIQKEEKTWW